MKLEETQLPLDVTQHYSVFVFFLAEISVLNFFSNFFFLSVFKTLVKTNQYFSFLRKNTENDPPIQVTENVRLHTPV